MGVTVGKGDPAIRTGEPDRAKVGPEQRPPAKVAKPNPAQVSQDVTGDTAPSGAPNVTQNPTTPVPPPPNAAAQRSPSDPSLATAAKNLTTLRDDLKKQADLDQTSPPGGEERLARRSHMATLTKAIGQLRNGTTIGDSLRSIDRDIGQEQAKLGGGLLNRLEQKVTEPDPELDKLKAKITGMQLAREDVRCQGTGWRAGAMAIDGGISFGKSGVGDFSVLVGARFAGPDTGEAHYISPYVKVAGWVSLPKIFHDNPIGPLVDKQLPGVAGVGLAYTLGLNGGKGNLRYGLPNVYLTEGDPVTGNAVNLVAPGVGAVIVSDRGGLGVSGRVPTATWAFSPAGRLYVEHPALMQYTKPLVTPVFDAKNKALNLGTQAATAAESALHTK
jgi:hypothetical protein